MRTYQNKTEQYKPRRSNMTSVELVEGETIEKKVERILQNKEPITDGAPEIFTERSEGIISAYNIRTDRWEIAAEAMDKVTASIEAKREGKGKVIELKTEELDKKDKKDNDTEGKSTEGKTE